MKPSDPAVHADACMASIIGHGNICTCIQQSACGRFIITGSAVRFIEQRLCSCTSIFEINCLQDHMCGLWLQELNATSEIHNIAKNAPLICFLKCGRGMPLTCGFGKLGKSEIQCFAGFDSGFIALWTVNHDSCASCLFQTLLLHLPAALFGRQWYHRYQKDPIRGR